MQIQFYISIIYSGSFGFDYIAVDTYIDLNSKKNTIRISIGDVEQKTIDRFIDCWKEIDYAKIQYRLY